MKEGLLSVLPPPTALREAWWCSAIDFGVWDLPFGVWVWGSAVWVIVWGLGLVVWGHVFLFFFFLWVWGLEFGVGVWGSRREKRLDRRKKKLTGKKNKFFGGEPVKKKFHSGQE